MFNCRDLIGVHILIMFLHVSINMIPKRAVIIMSYMYLKY